MTAMRSGSAAFLREPKRHGDGTDKDDDGDDAIADRHSVGEDVEGLHVDGRAEPQRCAQCPGDGVGMLAESRWQGVAEVAGEDGADNGDSEGAADFASCAVQASPQASSGWGQ